MHNVVINDQNSCFYTIKLTETDIRYRGECRQWLSYPWHLKNMDN